MNLDEPVELDKDPMVNWIINRLKNLMPIACSMCAINPIIMEYIDKNNILYENQFGFRKQHSTRLSMALTILMDGLHTAIDHNLLRLGVYLDLGKAFDIVDNKIRIKELHFYGIRGVALEWVHNFITNRK